jgi:tetratricopeptide (TPR) repeat protein
MGIVLVSWRDPQALSGLRANEVGWEIDTLKSTLLHEELALRTNPADESAAREMAIAFVLLKRGTMSDDDYERAQELLRDEMVFAANLTNARVLASAYVSAHETTGDLNDVGATVSELLAAEGARRLALGEAAAARVAFELAVVEDPLRLDALIGAAAANVLQNRAEDAETFINRALAIQSDNLIAQRLRGEIHVLQNELADAEKAFRRAHDLAPEDYDISDHLGWVLVANGQAEEGAELLRQAIEVAPGDAERQYRYAQALAKAGRHGDSAVVLEGLLNTPSLPSHVRESSLALQRVIGGAQEGAAQAAHGAAADGGLVEAAQ